MRLFHGVFLAAILAAPVSLAVQGTTLYCGQCGVPPFSSPNSGWPGVGWFGAGATPAEARASALVNLRQELQAIFDGVESGFACGAPMECLCWKHPTFIVSGEHGSPQEVLPGVWWVTLEFEQAAVSVCCTEC